jgi:hypothetical protein
MLTSHTCFIIRNSFLFCLASSTEECLSDQNLSQHLSFISNLLDEKT